MKSFVYNAENEDVKNVVISLKNAGNAIYYEKNIKSQYTAEKRDKNSERQHKITGIACGTRDSDSDNDSIYTNHTPNFKSPLYDTISAPPKRSRYLR